MWNEVRFPLYRILTPLAGIYGGIVRLRNFLFDRGILSSKHFPVPMICVGNLALGGTGKTPHVEYLIRLLSPHYRVAVLSRGYKRKTKGYLLADTRATSETIGDEPYQLKRKFPQLIVAVAEKRQEGMRQLLALPTKERPEVVVLDDAFQHRYVTPSLSILLTDSHRLYSRDHLLPVGRLREPASGVRRADAVIVTKCDTLPSATDREALRKELGLQEAQPLFCSTIRYGELQPLFPDEAPMRSLRSLHTTEVLLLTGIAHPAPLERMLRLHTTQLHAMAFPDHHAFQEADARRIQAELIRQKAQEAILIVTEKDAARLVGSNWLPAAWRRRLYVLPIEIGFEAEEQQAFDGWVTRKVATSLSKTNKEL